MFLSRLPKIRSSTWSMVVSYTKNSTRFQTTMDVELQVQSPPRQKLNGQRKLNGKAMKAWNRTQMMTSNMQSSSTHAVVQGAQTVITTMEAVSMANIGIQTPESTPVFALQLEPVPQTSKPIKVRTGSSPKPRKGKRRHTDVKNNPSPSSGGIPDPTQDYFLGCTYGPSPLVQPQHLLVVIDLNGTLLYRPNKTNPTKFNIRPHAQTFLKYCVDTFTVVIWSSARPANVNAMCNTILTPDIRSKVAAIWGRDKFGLTQADYDQRTQCYKRLTRVWQDSWISERHPAFCEGYRWDQTNTVLIDDSREKARTEPHNLIEVPEYFGDLKERDDILPQVHDYLNHLSMHSNVSACLQRHPWKPTVYG